ncbi:hypothetical protein RO1_00820 [Roseburia intestinalis XB6B4]|uniref:Uncharacterized protein n=1 Tax=Roseburia intestinalis XB6B4 TaxID=718255 RepID=D4KU75_9FIRM|nr:hypothetical protein RO1_00820 [Roseburia intestinalis XB6B4]
MIAKTSGAKRILKDICFAPDV